jgi:hypothetical protein
MSNGWEFKRGLDDDFMRQLEALAKESGWFADVLADEDLILGIRNNYLNVYWHGQSLFKIERPSESIALKFTTHPKYLIDPDLSKPVPFDGSGFRVDRVEALVREYKVEKTLALMKRAAKVYAGEEKDGVHVVAQKDRNVIDTEVAFYCERDGDQQGRYAPRIDLACFEDVGSSIRLRFWEAKLYSNKEIRAEGNMEARVVRQVREYRELLEKHRGEVAKSYQVVAHNLVEIAGWVSPRREVGQLVQQVAGGKPFQIDNPPVVGLIIYGFGNDQKGSKGWKTHIGKLEMESLMPLRCAGDPKYIRLCAGDMRELVSV